MTDYEDSAKDGNTSSEAEYVMTDAEITEQAINLRIDGWSLTEIASALKTTVSDVSKRIAAQVKTAGQYRKAESGDEIEIMRIDRMAIKFIERAISGDNLAVDTYLKLQARRAQIIDGIKPKPPADDAEDSDMGFNAYSMGDEDNDENKSTTAKKTRASTGTDRKAKKNTKS